MATGGRLPTIKDVARLAGVGLGTVSRVLNGSGSVSEATVARVSAAVETLGYRTNANAAALRGRVNRVIGVLVPDLENPAIPPVVKAIERSARAAGYSLMITSGDRDFAVEAQAIMTMVARGVQGLILIPTTTEGAQLDEALGPGRMPVVLLDRDFEIKRPSIGRVFVAHDSGMYQATRHLLATGHRNLLLLHARDNRAAISRQRGFERALAEVAVDCSLVRGRALGCDRSAEAACALVRAALAEAPAPDAIIAGHNRMLAGVISALGQRGLAVGRDVSVVTCDRTELAELYSPPIAWIDRHSWQIGEAAFQVFQSLLAEDGIETSPQILTVFHVTASICGRIGQNLAD